MLSRRSLLRLGGAAVASGAVASLLRRDGVASAPGGPPRRLILVLAGGGWDTCYALDPKEPTHVDVPEGAVRRFADQDVFVHDSRPNVTAFFEKHAAISSIVRGIGTDAINHSECQIRITTGTREATRPDLCSLVAHQHGRSLPVPYLILGDVAFTGPYAVDAARVGANNQLISLLDGAPGEVSVGPSQAEEALLRRYAEASAERARAVRGARGYNRRRVDDFAEAMERGQRLRRVRAFGRRGDAQSLGAQVDVALDALEHDLSQTVMINTRQPWDTHSENVRQAAAYEATFGELTRLVDELMIRPGRAAGTKMIDDTVVACLSELSRTPRMYNGGKDHWQVTAELIIGAGVLGGTVVGQTTVDAQAVAIDLHTGLARADGVKPLYSHLGAGLLSLCGVEPSPHFEVAPLDAFLA
jgi:uncharacterized protein (DUF1501 family)